ncbi:MAG TPA: sugar phosphate nucleotidyltransferase [Pirellulales bacterium]|jgi:D-glycero-alpha-D-manno-heptose 1-phosphate guanylyltransferase|nr:sugar phosphate nucleotidyltransferase [Pirellulales bacterium]
MLSDHATPKSACAIVLAGGRGKRISHLYPDLPKPMVPAAGEPFIEWVLQHLAAQGVRRALVSVGYLAEVVERYLARRPSDGLEASAVRETQPLGTGGAARLAAQAAAAERLVVVNGDSLVLADLRTAWTLLNREELDGVVVGVEMDDTARYGTLIVGAGKRLAGFREKRPGSGLINAGVYFFKRPLIDALPLGTPMSLESDLFPAWLAGGANFSVLAVRAPFLDIGTPTSVREAEGFIREHFAAAVTKLAA